MNAPARAIEWTEANQALLVAEFARLRALLGDGDTAAAAGAAAACRAAMPAPAAIDLLARLFRLSDFERDLLLLAAGVEMDARLAARCAEVQGAPQRSWASFGLALAVLPDPHWSAIASSGPLRRRRLIEVDERAGLTAARLGMDERVLHFIAGLNEADARLAPLLSPVAAAAGMAAAHQAVVAEALARLRAAPRRPRLLLLAGDDPSGAQDVAAAIAAGLGLGLMRMQAADLPAAASEQAALAELWSRESVLLASALLITQADGEAAQHAARFAERPDGLVMLAGRDPPAIACAMRHAVEKPDLAERRRLWRSALGSAAAGLHATIDALAAQYRLDARRIADIAAGAGASPAALHRACRGEAVAMPALAQSIAPRAGWDDLVLPQAALMALRQIGVHARHRLRVHHDWGFAAKSQRGLGIATLFWGDSGTGKTLAAEVLAGELDLALYRIDLSAVVSKYIGETEKNLRRLFDAAEDKGAMLLFDEADALFGKRSEVKDSHDRYANIEVSYLLQRMEAYGGLAILTTNQRAALDPAFRRRLRFVVHFPFPDLAQREAIWRAVLPPALPRTGVDTARLAQLAVAGGTIRNIALAAAFFAAEAERPLCMADLRRAAHLEAAKQDQPYAEAEMRGWA